MLPSILAIAALASTANEIAAPTDPIQPRLLVEQRATHADVSAFGNDDVTLYVLEPAARGRRLRSERSNVRQSAGQWTTTATLRGERRMGGPAAIEPVNPQAWWRAYRSSFYRANRLHPDSSEVVLAFDWPTGMANQLEAFVAEWVANEWILSDPEFALPTEGALEALVIWGNESYSVWVDPTTGSPWMVTPMTALGAGCGFITGSFVTKNQVFGCGPVDTQATVRAQAIAGIVATCGGPSPTCMMIIRVVAVTTVNGTAACGAFPRHSATAIARCID